MSDNARVFTIQWHITDRCNCRCAHCYQDAYNNEASWDELRAMLAKFAAFFQILDRPGMFTITGGEPLIHRHFWDLLEAIKEEHPQISLAILTNGTLIDAATASRLAVFRPEYVQVSIEGDRDVHDAIRGTGSYEQALNGIGLLSEKGVPVSLSFTAQRTNFRQIGSVARISRRFQGVKVWSDRMIPSWGDNQLECLNAGECSEYLKLMRKAKNVSMNRALQFLEGGRAYRCSAGESIVAVMPDGTVYPCRRLPLEAGNVLQQDMLGIYRCSLMKELREGVCSGCSNCLYQPVCNGGLRCLAYACTGDMWSPDPGCPLQAGTYHINKRRWL